MPILNETPPIEPLMRIMGLPPSLVRYCPTSSSLPLRTIPLRESALGKSVPVQWGDDCLLTTVDGQHNKLPHITLSVPGGPRPFGDVHLAILGGKGQVNLVLGGDQVRLVIGAETALRVGIHLAVKSTAFIGDHTTMGQARLSMAHGDLVIGDDCQFSEDVVVLGSDQHSICDLESGNFINAHRRHVRIGRHVWLGRRAMVLPDVTVATGSIVEPGAVVRANVASNTLVGGAPASVLRENVTWKR